MVDTNEIKKNIQEQIEYRVKAGFEIREDIIEILVEMVEEEYERDDQTIYIESLIDKLFSQHDKEQNTWKDPTDCDKIDDIFAKLEEKGIVARQNFACCNNCGHSEIGYEIKIFKEHSKPIGYTFYHS